MTRWLVTISCALACAKAAPSRSATADTAGGGAPAVVLETPDHRPSSFSPSPFVPPRIIERRLQNGIRVLVVVERTLPIVHIELVVRRGAADAPPGVASFTSELMIGREVVLLGAAWNSWVGYDAFGVSLRGITPEWTSNLPQETFSKLASGLRQPELTAARVESERRRRLSGFPRPPFDTEHRLSRAIRGAFYPPGHPHRTATTGVDARVPEVLVDDIREFLASQVTPEQVALVAVGDVALESFLDSVRTAFGGWTGTARARADLPEIVDRTPGGPPLTLIDSRGLARAHVTLVARGAPSGSDDVPALTVLDSLLGTSFVGRLHLSLRDEHGYTYSASSRLNSVRGGGYVEVQTTIGRSDLVVAITELRGEIARLAATPLDENTLAREKSKLLRQLPFEFASLEATVEALSWLAAYDLPTDEHTRRGERISRVTTEDLLRVAKQYLDPSQLRWFVVTDATAVQKDLARLGLGPAHVVGERDP
jgi:zinc protease